MTLNRSDIRVYSLLFAALLVTLMLYAGISSANAEGEVLGVKIIIAGPLAGFIGLLLVFKLIGLFKVDTKEDVVSTVEPRKLNKTELVNEKLLLEMNIQKINIRKDELEKMIAALDNNKDTVGAAKAGGMRVATRSG